MENVNKKVIYEAVLAHNAFINELSGYKDEIYSNYHRNKAGWYETISNRFNEILDFTGQSIDEFTKYVSTINLTKEQKRALFELRKEPTFRKLMGETALQQKSELENVLGSKITYEGMTFADENGAKVAVKTEQQLEQEFDQYNEKLGDLLSSGSITQEQYDSYSKNLDYIYAYYVSYSRGEQIPFRKMTNDQYDKIEEKAYENGISFSEQLYQETQDIRDDFDYYQDLQSHGMKK